MRGLSLTQPWASLMAWGAKRYETRDWHTPERGRVAIVASKGFPSTERQLCHEEPFASVLRANGVTIVDTRTTGPTHLPLCMVVGVVEIVDCISTTEASAVRRLSRAPSEPPAEHEQSFGNYAPGRYAFITRGAVAIDPVPVEHVIGSIVKKGGKLGFYTLSPACERAVLEGVARAEAKRSA